MVHLVEEHRVGVRDLGEGDSLNVYVKHEPGSESMFYEYDESAAGAAAMGAATAAVAAPAEEPAPATTAESTRGPGSE